MEIDFDPEDEIKNTILDICEVLSRRGYQEVSLGALMRILGVENHRAVEHDNVRFVLDEEFKQLLELRNGSTLGLKKSNSTLH